MAGWKTSLRLCTGCSHLGSSESHGWLLGFMDLIRGWKQLPGLAVFVTSGDKASAREEGLHPCLAHWRQTPAQRYVCNLIGISRIQQEQPRDLCENVLFSYLLFWLSMQWSINPDLSKGQNAGESQTTQTLFESGVCPVSKREIQLKEWAGSAPNSTWGTCWDFTGTGVRCSFSKGQHCTFLIIMLARMRANSSSLILVLPKVSAGTAGNSPLQP